MTNNKEVAVQYLVVRATLICHKFICLCCRGRSAPFSVFPVSRIDVTIIFNVAVMMILHLTTKLCAPESQERRPLDIAYVDDM